MNRILFKKLQIYMDTWQRSTFTKKCQRIWILYIKPHNFVIVPQIIEISATLKIQGLEDPGLEATGL